MSPVHHPEAISLLSRRLREHGVASFAEINDAAGSTVLNRGLVVTPANPTARWVSRVVNSGSHVVIPMPLRTSTKRGSARAMPKHTLYLVEAELEPVLKYAQASGRAGRGEFHPTIGALLLAAEGLDPDNHTMLRDRSGHGVAALVRMGFLEEAPFSHGERPKGLHWADKRFKAADPELLARAASAARRIIALQRGGD